MGATIGLREEDLFKPYTLETRKAHVNKVDNFMISLPSNLSEKNCHARKLKFMAESGIRQLGHPRIGIFADRQQPEPVHCEINAWQHFLNIIYREAVQRGTFTKFIDIMSASAVGQSTDQGTITEKPRVFVFHVDGAGERSTKVDIVNDSNTKFVSSLGNAISCFQKENSSELGCGLGYLASVGKEHYGDESQRHNKLPVRLIGDQAIALANFSYRLIDSLKISEESPAQKLKRLVLGKIAQFLRNAGALFNKIEISAVDLGQLKEFCTLSFNLYVLFFLKWM